MMMSAIIIQKIMSYRSTVVMAIAATLLFITPYAAANFTVDNKSDYAIKVGVGYRGPGRESRVMGPGDTWSVSTVKTIQRVTVWYQDNPTLLEEEDWPLVGEIKDQWFTPTQKITIESTTTHTGEPAFTVTIKTPLTTKILKGPQ